MAVYVAQPPLFAVYSQSWPIPKPNMTVAKTNCFPSGKSLNSDWVQGKVKRNSQTAFDNRKVAKARGAYSERTGDFSRRSLFVTDSDNNDEDISEMARDIKLTLLFKRLSQQVRKVNQEMNRNKVFSYKHYHNNEGISSPALRRSQLAVALSKREIPATEAPFEPITDVGAPVPTAQPHLQDNQSVRVCCRDVSAFTSPKLFTSIVKSRRCSTPPNVKISTQSSQKQKVNAPSEKEFGDADTTAKELWITECSDFKELFVVNPTEDKALQYEYHDPFPGNWIDETVENAIFRGSKKKDLFMQRLSELGKLEEETVLNERKKDKEYSNLVFVKLQQLSQKNKKQVGVQTGLPTSRAVSARLPSSNNLRSKSKVKVCRSYSARKATNSVHSGDENSEHSRIQTLRNTGYKLGQSFVPGSLFPKTREIATQFDKTSQKHAFLKTSNSPPGMYKDTGCKSAKSQFCQICKVKTPPTSKHNCTRNNTTLNTLRTQYELKTTESYDITELAKTLEPPCKDQMKNSEHKAPAEKTSLKGIIPGKSCFSQRRISLTLDNLLVKGINTKPATTRCKSGKRAARKKLYS